METRYRDTLFRSRLEARWAAFFDLAGVEWAYEPDERKPGWWPDFRVKGIRFDGKVYSVLCEVKPVGFSPIAIDPAFDKALGEKWRLMLGHGPKGDYVGFLASKRGDQTKSIGIRLTDDGLEAAPLGRTEYGSWAERVWGQTNDRVGNAGVSSAVNRIIQRNMGKRMFDFGDGGDAA